VPVTKRKIVYEEREGPVDADGRPLPEDDATQAPALDPTTGRPTTPSSSEAPQKTYDDQVTADRPVVVEETTRYIVPRQPVPVGNRQLTKQK
jgi:hypothetical protein